MLQPTGYTAQLFSLYYGSPFAQAILEPHLRRETHSLSDSLHLLVAWVLYPALAQVSDVRARYDTTSCLIDLLAAPPASVRMTVHLQEALELLSDVHMIYDTRRNIV